MTAARQCSATFVQRVTLTVSRDGNGDGVITGEGINCGTDCNQAYDFGALVALQARAAAGSVFSGWSGDCRVSNRGGGADVTMNEDATCTATFQRRVELRVNFDGAGAGRVTLDPGNRQCTSDCTNTFDMNDQVQLVAVPDRNTVFRGWSGDCLADPSNAELASVRMDSDKSCTARFMARFTLTIRKAGTGDGVVVAGENNDIDCGDRCSAVFDEGTRVNLNVDPTNGRFTGWGTDCSGASTTTTVTMNGNRTCEAAFQADVTLNVDTVGLGSISSQDEAIACGEICSAQYTLGTRVTLTAQPAPESNSFFSRWSGDCAGRNTPTISFTIDQGMRCTATFRSSNSTTTTTSSTTTTTLSSTTTTESTSTTTSTVTEPSTTSTTSTTVANVNNIYDIVMTPDSPARLVTNNDVNISFLYFTDEPNGVRIFARPVTNGNLTPQYAASGSSVLPVGEGKGSQSFTITGTESFCGSRHVDQVRFQMWNTELTTLLLESFINVDYTFFDPCIG
jgi:hypothetical protein